MRQKGEPICTRSRYDFAAGLGQPLEDACPARRDAGASAEEDTLPAEL